MTEGQEPAAPGSALEGLRRRRQSERDARYLDVKVPDTDPAVWLRLRVLPVSRIERIYEQWNRRKDDERTVKREAALIAEASLGLFEVVDGVEVSIDPNDRSGEWLGFGPELAELLGIEGATAVDLVREVFGEDTAVLAVSAKYGAWLDVPIEERDRAGN